jgi:hypothetical protein
LKLTAAKGQHKIHEYGHKQGKTANVFRADGEADDDFLVV